MGSFDKLILWLFGDRKKARDVAERHHATVTANLPTGLEGDAQDGMDGMLYGGVIWPVEPGTHGAKAFLSAWCFLAYYDGQKQECYMLDDLDGTRHPGARPLKVGEDLKVQSGDKRSGRGMVIRSAEEGEEGQLKNVFQHYEPNLVAHHLPENQPDNSSMVCDPHADGRKGGLHYALRVREWVKKFCSGGKYKEDGTKYYAPLLNMSRNGDGTDAHGGAHFARGEAALSDEAKGPLACADDNNHRLGTTDESTIHQGANAIQTLYGPVRGLYMPEEVIEDQWEDGSKGPFVMRVEKRPDLLAKHKNYCGKEVPGVLKWQTWDVIREYPTRIKEPDPDPEPDPKPTPKPTYPAMSVPPEGLPPTAGTPYELESPSQYGHPMPSIPDGPLHGEGEPNAANDNPQDAFWVSRFGHTEEDWQRTPVAGHRFTLPEYQFGSARDQGERWPTVKETHELLDYNPDGSIRARIAATGPGKTVEAPAWARPWHAFKAMWQGAWRESRNLFLIFAGKSSSGVTVAGKGGIGVAIPNIPNVVSGWQFELDFADSSDEPNINFTKRDAVGANSGVGKFKINGTEVGSGGTGDVTAASSITDHTLVRGDGGAKGVQDSGVTLDDSDNITGVAALGATTVELGHASDTTLARASAGNVSVEGNLMYRAGGTDVPVTDGGTGASTEDAALASLIGGATGVTPTELHNVGLHDSTLSAAHGKASVASILTMDPTSLAFGGTPVIGQIPRWHKITIPYNQAGLGDQAAQTANATLFVLPSGGMIHAVVLKHSTDWDNGGGGARNEASVGITGTLNKYAAAFRWDQAVTNTNFQLSTIQGIEAIGATTNIKMQWDSSASAVNLNTGTQGSLDCYVLLSGLL